MDDKLLRDYKFFESKLDSLLKKAPDHFVIVKNQNIVSIFKTIEDARKHAEDNKMKSGTFIIQKITKNIEYISRLAI